MFGRGVDQIGRRLADSHHLGFQRLADAAGPVLESEESLFFKGMGKFFWVALQSKSQSQERCAAFEQCMLLLVLALLFGLVGAASKQSSTRLCHTTQQPSQASS